MGISRTMKYATTHRFFSAVLIMTSLMLAAVLLGGCGKSGMPSPRKTQETFTITEHTLSAMGDCVVAKGTASGAVKNVESIILEVAPIQSYDDCPGCPFTPRESGEFPVADIQLDPQNGQFMFSYCPSIQAPMYRWRLVGKNVFRGLPYATTTPKILVMPEQ